MRFELTAASLLASTAAAFSNTSPFVLFSTSSKNQITWPKDQQLVTTTQVGTLVRENLASCTTGRYVLISQPGVHASDLRHPATGRCLAPNLCEAATAPGVKSHLDAAEVVGRDDFFTVGELEDAIEAACGAVRGEGGYVVESYALDALPERGDLRSAKVLENDTKLGKIISKAASSGDDYTVIYFSPRNEGKIHGSEHADSPVVELELKRSLADAVAPRAAAKDGKSSAPLFVKYQFFTPGIFMALVAILIMLAILYVGLSAVSSLEIPYGAFDKEMGPAAQKKNN